MINIEYSERDKIMPMRGTLNVDKAKKLLNYNPVNPLEIGYKKYISWYKNFCKNL